jgi:Tfp pilus assembly protein PilV
MVTRRPRRRRNAGYTLVEVMMAVLIGMIGLIGTVALQQTMLNATQNANDSAIALRIATQKMEEFDSAITIPGSTDGMCRLWAYTGRQGRSITEWVDVTGHTCAGGQTARCRFQREWRVDTDTSTLCTAGTFCAPYTMYVRVSFNTDSLNVGGSGGSTTVSAKAKMVELDATRQKTWQADSTCPTLSP